MQETKQELGSPGNKYERRKLDFVSRRIAIMNEDVVTTLTTVHTIPFLGKLGQYRSPSGPSQFWCFTGQS